VAARLGIPVGLVGFYQLDCADDVAVELGEVFGGNPILLVLAGAGDLDGVAGEELGRDLEAYDVAGAAILSVPIAGDLRGVGAREHRVEDGLLGEPRWELAPAAVADE